ncbi:hypothetical protein LTR56_016613 [Elasticomyces elasticus]|nr:hypothetical protein LTR56_016613 [Elasticomyces elasticus]KAK3650644.1 hypothetical protein LTR22_012502 [Elasticomyces elasticus]KAK4913977.1 hypothetical protein LTR49_017795 [Elasticomyces elasticus]KAK5753141.1 hypothetical protein LTS12_016820 [Elasticomyces elasticus]
MGLTSNSRLSLVFLLCLVASPGAHALSVAKKAAVGIAVGFGLCLIAAAIGGLYLTLWKRKQRKEARARGEVELTEPKLTNKEIIEAYGKDQPRNFNIWGEDQPELKDVRAKMAAERTRDGPVAGQ